MSLPQQTPAQPMTTHVPKMAMLLPESVTQPQVNVHPQHISIPLTQLTTGRSNTHCTTNWP